MFGWAVGVGWLAVPISALGLDQRRAALVLHGAGFLVATAGFASISKVKSSGAAKEASYNLDIRW